MIKRLSYITIIFLAMTFVSCTSTDYLIQQNKDDIESLKIQITELKNQVSTLQEKIEEPIIIVKEPDVLIEEPKVEIIENLEETVINQSYQIGEIGPTNGIVFSVNNTFLELGEPFYEVPSYNDALSYCQSLGDYRLPTIEELLAIYDQLLQAELIDIDWTYYWSSEVTDDERAKIVNFDTGFEGNFYKSMDFVSVLPVREI